MTELQSVGCEPRLTSVGRKNQDDVERLLVKPTSPSSCPHLPLSPLPCPRPQNLPCGRHQPEAISCREASRPSLPLSPVPSAPSAPLPPSPNPPQHPFLPYFNPRTYLPMFTAIIPKPLVAERLTSADDEMGVYGSSLDES